MHMPDVLNSIPPQTAEPARQARGLGVEDGEDGTTGDETARNGSSFLAMIERMIAGPMDGIGREGSSHPVNAAEREAGGLYAPGDGGALTNRDVEDPKGPLDSAAGARSARGRNTRTALGARHELTSRPSEAESMEGPISAKGRGVPASGAEETLKGAITGGPDGLVDASRATDADGLSIRLGAESFEDKPSAETNGHNRAIADALVVGSLPAAGLREGRAIVEDARDKQDHEDASEAKALSKADGRDRKDRKQAISVIDERSHALGKDASVKEAASPETSVTETADGVAEMSMDFRADRSGEGFHQSGPQGYRGEAAPSGERAFASLLSEQLKANSGEFVRAGQIVLRDGNAGTIRLTLHPESLGNVKISLELGQDRKISGKIEVASKEAFDAFSESLGSLDEAFREGGFDTAGFDLSWSGQGNPGDKASEMGAFSSPFYASSVPDVMSRAESSDIFGSGRLSGEYAVIDVFA